jgi:hypothetical protein
VVSASRRRIAAGRTRDHTVSGHEALLLVDPGATVMSR